MSTYLGAAAFYIFLALLLRELWKMSRATKQIEITEKTNYLIDKLTTLKQEYNEISQFIFDYEQRREDSIKTYQVRWIDSFGESKIANIFGGNGRRSTDEKKNLKRAAEQYRLTIADEIDKTINELYSYHKKNVKNPGGATTTRPLTDEIKNIMEAVKEAADKKY